MHAPCVLQVINEVFKTSTELLYSYSLERELQEMVFDPGVRQAYIDLAPALKGDRRVKKHNLAVFRLQQYNRVLQACLCPTALFLLLLLYLFAEKQACSQFKTHRSDLPSASTLKNPSLNVLCANSLVSRHDKRRKKMSSCLSASCRVVKKSAIQLLLLRAGDVEPNPGPKRGVF